MEIKIKTQPIYLSQRNNRNLYTGKAEPSVQCSIASAAMVLNWHGIRINEAELYRELDITAKLELNSDNYNSSDNVCRTMNYLLQKHGSERVAKRIEVDSPDKLFSTLDEYQQPVFSSTGTALTTAGHFFVPYHHSNGCLLVNDPYGNPFDYSDKNGQGVILLPDLVERIYNKKNGGRWVIVVD